MGGEGGKPRARSSALVKWEVLENEGETAAARVARTAKRVVNFMMNNEGRWAG
jgi:hypothetical protein